MSPCRRRSVAACAAAVLVIISCAAAIRWPAAAILCVFALLGWLLLAGVICQCCKCADPCDEEDDK